MKKLVLILTILTLSILLVGCEKEENDVPLEILPESEISMENLDDYMYRDDVQYVDLRNFDSRFSNGYIDGFESIPFFDYLDYRLFDRNDTYEFDATQILDEEYLRDLFDEEKAIFLYADGCIRSGYLKDLLNYLGYERVYVLGGFFEYQGEYLILGDDTFYIGDTFYVRHIDQETLYTYYMYGMFDMGRKITSIRFDILDEQGVSLRSPDYDLEINYNEQLTILEDYIVFDIVTFNELYDSITNLETSHYDEITGYTLGYSEAFITLLSYKNIG